MTAGSEIGQWQSPQHGSVSMDMLEQGIDQISTSHMPLSLLCGNKKVKCRSATPWGLPASPDGGHLSLLASTCQVVYTGVSLTSI